MMDNNGKLLRISPLTAQGELWRSSGREYHDLIQAVPDLHCEHYVKDVMEFGDAEAEETRDIFLFFGTSDVPAEDLQGILIADSDMYSLGAYGVAGLEFSMENSAGSFVVKVHDCSWGRAYGVYEFLHLVMDEDAVPEFRKKYESLLA